MAKHILSLLASSACILYGLFIFSAASGTFFFLIWIILGLLILLQSHLSWLSFLPILAQRILRVLLILFWIGLFLLLIIALPHIFSCFHSAPDQNASYLIVFGAQVRKDGPSLITKYRLDAASAYLKENPNTICITTGGKGWNEPDSEAVIMKQYLIAQGIPASHILEETTSTNTLENIQHAKQIIVQRKENIDSLTIIVTNSFHVYRGMQLAKSAGFTNVQGLAAKSDPLYLPNNILRECFGIAKDTLYGNMKLN